MEIKYIFCIVFCFWAMKTTMAQSDNNLFALEKQLCFIQDTLYLYYGKIIPIQMIITAILYNIDSLSCWKNFVQSIKK